MEKIPQSKTFDIVDKAELMAVGRALSSEMRIEVLMLLENGPCSINEIARLLEIPASSAAMHIKVLEEAGLIRTELKPGARGSMKNCMKTVDSLQINLNNDRAKATGKTEVISMPIGNFVDYRVEPTCGIVSSEGHIDEEDEPRCFYNPNRTRAKLLWFGAGYVEYRFSNAGLKNRQVCQLELSAELCSEAAFYDMDQISDITVWINGIDAGTWRSPSDYGGRRGKLNPAWWLERNTQYGMLKTWKIGASATYIDGEAVSRLGISDYQLDRQEYISVRIGIKEDAEYTGGVNIFGDSFGDYPQNIVMKLSYQDEIE